MSLSASDFAPSKLYSVSGLTALVTGGGTGIGLYSALALASNGATVYILGRRIEALQQAADAHNPGLEQCHAQQQQQGKARNGSDGQEAEEACCGKLIPIQGDQTDPESLKKVAEEIRRRQQQQQQQQQGQGRAGEASQGTSKVLDILVVNAGVGGKTQDTDKALDFGNDFDGALKELDNSTLQDFDQLFHINVWGYWKTVMTLLPLLKASADAKTGYSPQVIFIASNAAVNKKPMNNMLYNLTKASIIHLARMLSVALAPARIRVNSLLPGLFPSELVAGKDSRDSSGATDFQGTAGQSIPAGRPGDPREIGAAVLQMAAKGLQYRNGSVDLFDGGALQMVPSTY